MRAFKRRCRQEPYESVPVSCVSPRRPAAEARVLQLVSTARRPFRSEPSAGERRLRAAGVASFKHMPLRLGLHRAWPASRSVSTSAARRQKTAVLFRPRRESQGNPKKTKQKKARRVDKTAMLHDNTPGRASGPRRAWKQGSPPTVFISL